MGKEVVSARDLYDFLGFDRSQWSRWAKKNIEKNPFAQDGIDWQGFDIMSNGNNTKEYALTIDFAERLSMLARTEKGEEIRRWFQSLKKKPKELSRKDLALMVVQAEEEIERLQIENQQLHQTVQVQAPKVEYVEAVLSTDECMNTTEIAAEFSWSAQKLNKELERLGVQYKTNGTWVLSSKYKELERTSGVKYTDIRTILTVDSNGKTHARIDRVWTQRGRALIWWLLKRDRQMQQVALARID